MKSTWEFDLWKIKIEKRNSSRDFDNNDDTVLAPTSQNPVDDPDDIREFTSSHQCFWKKNANSHLFVYY